MKFSRFDNLAPLALSLLGIIYFSVIATDGTFDFFRPAPFDTIFDHQFLSLLSFHLDIDPKILRHEAFLDDQGHAYTYFGILPALFRLAFWPFVDLSTHSVARIVVLIVGVACALLAQSAWRIVVNGSTYPPALRSYLTVTGVVLIWFVSPMPILVASPTFWHEPYLAAMLIFLLIIRCFLARRHNSGIMQAKYVIALGALVALSIHTRLTVALGCGVMLAEFYLVDAGLALKAVAHGSRSFGRLLSLLSPHLIGSILVIASLTAYFAMNYAKWGDPWELSPMERSVMFQQEGLSPRFKTVIKEGRFNAKRIIPNLIEYLFPDATLHDTLRHWFGLGVMRREPPFMPVLVWWPWLVLGTMGTVQALRGVVKNPGPRHLRGASLIVGASIPAILTLSYPTITLRYRAEIWLVFFAGTLLCMGQANQTLERIAARGTPRRLLTIAIAASSALLFVYVAEYKDFSWFNNIDDKSLFMQIRKYF